MQIAKINVTIAEAVEEIDIGGVTLIRAAAKNRKLSISSSDSILHRGKCLMSSCFRACQPLSWMKKC